MLSLGEQQRVAFLRLLLHEPSLAFLDEATGALDSATEASCYRALHKHSTGFVSVGKPMSECTACDAVIMSTENRWEMHLNNKLPTPVSKSKHFLPRSVSMPVWSSI